MSSDRTVFTLQSLMMLTGNFDTLSLTQSLSYYQKKGLIRRLRRGVYSKLEYDVNELACAVFFPSYISLQYVLLKAGVIFQYSDAVTCVSSLNRDIMVDGRTFSFRRIKPDLWADMDGILQKEGYLIATPERALVDMMYLYPGIEYFDNMDSLDKGKVSALSLSYGNKSLSERIARIYG